jgi:hypothetical protein
VSDARWIDIATDFAGAADHFRNAVALYEIGGFEAPGLGGYTARMAFMHAMLAAHTSLESGLLRILELIGEEKPLGEHWHADMVRRAGLDLPGIRPAILDPDLAAAADRTRRFRHVAMRAYDSFDSEEARPAVKSARKLADGLSAALDRFREALEPS